MELYAVLAVFAPFIVGAWMLLIFIGAIVIDGRLARILSCARDMKETAKRIENCQRLLVARTAPESTIAAAEKGEA